VKNFFDEATGAIESDLFDFLVECEITRNLRHQNFATILMVQPDKKPYASETLRTLAALIRKNVRDTDLIGRMNDVRFGVLLLYAGLDGAYIAASRILEHVNSYNFPYEAAQRLSVSIGGACFPTNSTEKETLLKAAQDSFAKATKKGSSVCLPGLPVKTMRR
jgi:diguanylate cyclase (GGDEF)-like protein